jgi:hypothetical protein
VEILDRVRDAAWPYRCDIELLLYAPAFGLDKEELVGCAQ